VTISEEHAIGVYGAASVALDVLAGMYRDAKCTCEMGFYSPDVVAHFLNPPTWLALESACEGVGASGNEIRTNSRQGRATLVAIKSDLEQGTDNALLTYPFLWWDATTHIYELQKRTYTLWQARGASPGRMDLQREPYAPEARAAAYRAISVDLGWRPHECQ